MYNFTFIHSCIFYGTIIKNEKSGFANAEEHRIMVDKRYYEKLGGFSYVLEELRKKIGEQPTDILMNDAVNLCNELCEKYKGLPKRKRCIPNG